MNRKQVIGGICGFGLFVGAGLGFRALAAGIPAKNALTYSGVLEDSSGPVSGEQNIMVLLLGSDGKALCQTTSQRINVANGRFAVQLPDDCTAIVAENRDLWAQVLVNGSDAGSAKIGAVPFAVEASHATAAETATQATAATSATGALAAQISALQSDVLNAKAASTAPAWVAPVLNTGWRNFESAGLWQVAGYTKDAMGFVHLRGMVTRESGSDDVILTLPEGYRPEKQEMFPQAISANWGRVTVYPDGTVHCPSMYDPSHYLNLSGIVFAAR
jgi:hypothetical protein